MSVRAGFKDVKRCMIKVGSNVLTNDQGRLSIGRIGHIVEQIAKLVSQDRKEVILVSSGAVAVGSRRLEFQRRLSKSLLQVDNLPPPSQRASASAGQAAFMAIYDQMFAQFDLMVGNVLLTHYDLSSPGHISTFSKTIDELLSSGIVPVLNENDVTNQVLKDSPPWFKDNDSLSAKLASDLQANLLLLLTDVSGVFTAPPGVKGGHLLDYYSPAIDVIQFGEKSSRGRGGMESKMNAAWAAAQRGVDVVVASGFEPKVIDRIFQGEVLGTVFTNKWEMQALTPRQVCKRACDCRPALMKLTTEQKDTMLMNVAKALRDNKEMLLKANAKDLKRAVEDAQASDLDCEQIKLTDVRIQSLADGLELLARTPPPTVLERRELTEHLILEQVTQPIGVVLCVTENSVEVLPQVLGLTLRTGNALILYDDGTLTAKTKEAMLTVIRRALGPDFPSHALQCIGPEVDLMRLVTQREGFIDVILPRGVLGLAQKIVRQSNIPVLGNIETTCHVYLDESADLEKCIEIVLDSKLTRVGPGCHEGTNYLSCNAVDTILVHKSLVEDGRVLKVVKALTEEKVQLHGGPRAASQLGFVPAPKLDSEWHSKLAATIEIVDNVNEAVTFINTYGSGLVDTLVAEDPSVVEVFMQEVDSACVFHNASTRFADGYRLGQGAETGVSTRRAHSRGPVGVKGLLTSRWLVRSSDCHTVKQEAAGKWSYTHRLLPVSEVDWEDEEEHHDDSHDPKGKAASA